jgi:hypothetical protein
VEITNMKRPWLFAALLLAYTAGPACAKDKFVPASPATFRPEMIVELAYPGWTWCRTFSEYQEYTVHLLRGEITKARDFEQRERCGPIPAAQRYRVLSVRRIGRYSMLELGPEDGSRADGFWTMHEGLRAVKRAAR